MTAKVLNGDFERHFQYAWGTLGDHPGGFFSVYDTSVEQQRNLYFGDSAIVAGRSSGREAGRNKAFLVRPPVYAAWR